ncbi:MAG: hypothetical protein JNL90_10745 [Planctomycetes bacterium]|nr:hypothetical protein [Planctomycetota bacterium]
MILDLSDKPHLRELFDWLRSGRHVCADDGPGYLALRLDVATHRDLFAAIGFELVEHPRGFYYFRSDADLGKEATQLAVFFFVLVEAWNDAGKDIEATAFDPGGHATEDLPHLKRDSWRRCMAEAGVTTDAELVDTVRKLDRYGFTEQIPDGRFRFRTPAWRFFDLCLEVWKEHETAPTTTEGPKA